VPVTSPGGGVVAAPACAAADPASCAGGGTVKRCMSWETLQLAARQPKEHVLQVAM
jgi:hypothetical protein